MATVRHTLVIKQGTTFKFRANYWLDDEKTQARDLTNFNARAQIRRAHDSATVVYSGVSPTEFTMGNGYFIWTIPEAVTKNLPAPFEGVYDIELIDPDGNVESPIEGPVEIRPEVTK